MCINAEKTKAMMVTGRCLGKKMTPDSKIMNIQIEDIPMNQVQSQKLLSVI